jgi:aquaporin Z
MNVFPLLLAEFLGSFFFIGVIAATAFAGSRITLASASSYAPIAIGLALAVAILGFGAASGGHFNPAVSLARIVFDALDGDGKTFGRYLLYMVAQLLGCCVAVLVVVYLFRRPV